MTNTTISNNSGATYGGGAYIGAYSQNNIVLTDLTVSENEATASVDANTGIGGGFYIDTASSTDLTVTISGGTYSGNSAEYQGGAVYIKPYLIITGSVEICGNHSYSNGGAVFANAQMEINGGDSEETAVLIHDNYTENGAGGGVYGNSTTEYAVTASGWVKVYNNKACSTSGNGGGIAVSSGGMYLVGNIWIYGNSSYGSYGGGGLYQSNSTAGTIYLGDGVKVYDNTSATNGGGVTSRYHFRMEDGAEIYNNTATSNGGAVNAMYVTMDGGEVHGNSAANGGAFYDYNDSTGASPASYYSGGAIYSNKATNGSGGGIHMYTYYNIVYITGDIEIYDNSATSNGGGVLSTHHLYITGGSIHDNTAAKGGGVYISGYQGQMIDITDGIIYDNSATGVNSGNDIALNTVSTSYVVTDATTTYTSLSMNAANTFTDTENNITGSYWYDEGNRVEEYSAVSVNNESSAYYYTFVYTNDDTVAKVYDKTKNDYVEFTTVQAAVDAIAKDTGHTTYGNQNNSSDSIEIIMIADSREDVTIPSGVTVTLDLAGYELKGMALSVIMVESGATLTIEDSSEGETGTITGGSGTNDSVRQASSSTIYMSGGGLYIEGTAILNSGTISGNKATYGAGVYVGKSGKFTMNGGSIESNSASNGGGVYVYRDGSYSVTTIKQQTTGFTMTGGSITSNKASNGAGIYFVKTAAVISGGSITGNTATGSGGGIYVNGVSYIQISDAEITGNTAVNGGGIYSDTNTTTITVSNDSGTVSLYGNKSTSNKGNDVYANVGGGSLTLLAAADMGNDAYTSWLDANADGSDTYPYYYEDGFNYGSSSTTRNFYLTATSYSGSYVAYIPSDNSSNTIYQVAETESGETTYTYTMTEPTGGYVTSAKGTAYSTLQGAINAATSGDTIYLLSDVEESLTVTGKSVIIDFNGYTISSTGEYGFYLSYTSSSGTNTELILNDTTMDFFHNTDTGAEGTLTVATSNSSDFPRAIYSDTGNVTYPTKITVEGILITGFGNEDYASESGTTTYQGGAIYAKGFNEITIKSGTQVTKNYAYQGGAIYATGNNEKLIIEDNVEIKDNKAYQGGGIYMGASGKGYTSYFTVGAATISGNSAYKAGGIYIGGYNANDDLNSMTHVTMTGTTISDNQASSEAGGAYLQYGIYLTMTDCVISGNTSGGNYSGIITSGSSYVLHNVTATISGCEFKDNIAGNGYGALAVTYGTATITGCTFTGNQAATYTSAFYSATVQNLTMTDCTFTENVNTASGYVMYLNNGLNATLTNVTVKNNTTSKSNGAVYIYNSASVTSNGSGANGDYKITFDKCDISDNNGYGIEQSMQNATYGVFTTLKNTTISGNGGYGVYVRTSGNTVDYINTFTCRDKSVINIDDGTSISGNGNSGVYAYYATVNMSGGEICNNTSTSYGGGVYANCANFNMSGGSIYGNKGTYGGGVFLREMTTSYEGGTYYESVTADTISGGEIYGNTSTAASVSNSSSTNPNHAYGGGGVYVGDYNELIMTGGTITDNTATLYGGGVGMSDIAATFDLQGGGVYGNTANLGQDVYAYYSSTYASTVLKLIAASGMFEDGSGMTGIGWLNESTEVVTKTAIDYDPAKKIYPLTLEYETDSVVAVIWNTSFNGGNGGYEEFTSVQAAVDALQADKTNGTGNYYTSDVTSPEIILVDDAVGNVEISGGQTLTINLNGYTLKGNTTAIKCYGTLTIKDVQYTGEIAGKGDSYIGTITGTAAENGGGIAVYSGGTVTMTSGQIANCTAGGANTGITYGGAGVYVENGTFVLGGTASINNCSTLAYGSAVFITGTSGTFTLQDDAVIENNSSKYGAVYLIYGTFKMTGGSVTGNTATDGGGAMYIRSGTAKLSGGEISSNTATNYGGGIYIYSGTVTLSGDIKITENETTASLSSSNVLTGAGGGIYMNSGTLNIKTGAEITDNSSVRGGAIYQYNGTINMTGGQITGNTAEYGGGLVQYPTQSGKFTMTGGVLCDNTSSLGSAGNDIYSVSESYTYSGSSYPTATLIRAADMDYTDENYNASYNVWKDDSYDGTNRTAEIVGKGQYITEKITTSTNLMLTAAKYKDTAATEETTTDLTVQDLTLTGITDGTSKFNEVDKPEYASKTYTVNGETVTYTDWDSTRLNNAVAEEWTAGSDDSATNGLVRTFDTVTYNCNAAVGFNSGTGDETKTVTLYVEVTVPLSSDEVDMSISGSGLVSSEVEEDDDEESQTLTAYFEIPEAGNNYSFTLTLSVKAMKNGDTIEPVITSWIDEDTTNTVKEIKPTAVTVSATGMYNVTILQNSQLAYVGYFDLDSGEEITEDEYTSRKQSGGNVVYGAILGYGITLSMWNIDSTMGMKGIEVPEGDITFTLEMKGALNTFKNETTTQINTAAPYVWAYKANEDTDTGSGLNDEVRNVNMDWNDEDDTSSTTQYAYDGAPFNTGGDAKSCYSGGAWSATGSQPQSSDTSTTVTFTVSGYTINSTFSTNYPTQTSNGVTSSVFSNNYSRAFSAGYIQMLYPIDLDNVKEEDYGYLQVYMEGITSSLSLTPGPGGITSESTADSSLADLEYFVKWYTNSTDEYKTYATNEVKYSDNYVAKATGLYISSGGDETVTKTNYFNNESNGTLSGSGGTGSTPLGSVVYIGSDVTFSSDEINAIDRTDYYDSQTCSATEYNYMTAMNLLQKFDAAAYTPASTTFKVVNEKYTLSSQTNSITDGSNTVFRIQTSESATEWSSTKTMSYTLTILYAAKPDGSNWTYTTYNGYESPTPEMDKYGEDDLIYFETLKDLYDYFGYNEDGSAKGNCVGILYEFRDCCIRTSRAIKVTAQMNVTNEFSKTGKTYCITNDVLAWSTYRPIYKQYYNSDERFNYSFTYSWHDTAYGDKKNDVQAYGQGNNGTGTTLPDALTTAWSTYTTNTTYTAGNTDCSYAKLATYNNGYVKTEYSGGYQVANTHSGYLSGNTLLLYTMESSIAIAVTDTVSSGNIAKSQYDIGNGERTANFEVTPIISSSSSVSNSLVTNGTQQANVTITITLPKGLTYDAGTLKFNYGTTDDDYQEGELAWNTSVVENADGTTTITVTTVVSDISKNLPTISYSTTIGDASGENDLNSGDKLETKAEIYIEYEEIGQISTYTKKASVEISVVKNTNNFIWIASDGEIELGEDFVFSLKYKTSNAVTNVEIGDVLPFNGDGRNTEFDGGYLVTSITLNFDSSTTLDAFLDGEKLSSSGSSNSGELESLIKYKTGFGFSTSTQTNLSTYLGGLLDTLYSEGTVLSYSSYTVDENTEGDGNYSVTFELSEETKKTLTQLATSTGGIGFYFCLPSVAAGETVTIDINLSPVSLDTGASGETQLISDDDSETQTGGNIYRDNLFYRVLDSGTKGSGGTAVLGASAANVVITRGIAGYVWMDYDQDGNYNTVSGSTDEPLAGIDVYLYSGTEFDIPTGSSVTRENVSGTLTWTQGSTSLTTITMEILDSEKTLYPVLDVLGNLVTPETTSTKGYYKFDELYQGTYYVVFKDDEGNYTIADTTESPIAFERLSVTTYDETFLSKDYYNRSLGYYEDEDASYTQGGAATLTEAHIANEVTDPSLTGGTSTSGIVLEDGTQTGSYVSSGWNLGLYYIDLELEKDWENILSAIDEGVAVTFTVTGTVDDGTNTGGTITVVKNTYTITQGAKADSLTVTVTENENEVSPNTMTATVTNNIDSLKEVIWKLSTVALQAESEDEKTITYTVTESAVEQVDDGNGNITTRALTGFVTELETTDNSKTSSTISVTATNTQVLYNLNLYKISENSTATDTLFLAGAEFTLYDDRSCDDDDIVTLVTDSAVGTSGSAGKYNSGAAYINDSSYGLLSIGSLAAGTYYLKETTAPEGYLLNNSIWEIEITYEESDPTVPVITITQVVDEDGYEIAKPSSFTLDSNNTTTGTLSTYYVEDEIGNTTSFDGTSLTYTISFEMENYISYELPESGGSGNMWYMTVGIMLILLAVWMMIVRRKKSRG